MLGVNAVKRLINFGLTAVVGITVTTGQAAARDRHGETDGRVAEPVVDARAKLKASGMSYPAENPGLWITDNDYPPEAVSAKIEGRVGVEVSIAGDGAVTGCRILESSGSSMLDETTCRLVRQRGKFVGAFDRRHRPIASTYSFATRWVLPSSQPHFLSGWRLAATLRIDKTGKVISCVQSSSGPRPEDFNTPCPTETQSDPRSALALRGGPSGPEIGEVTLEKTVGEEGVPPQPLIYANPDRTTLRLMTVTFDVGNDGRVTNCKVVANIGLDEGWCNHPPGPYPPQAQVRHAVYTVALSRNAQ